MIKKNLFEKAKESPLLVVIALAIALLVLVNAFLLLNPAGSMSDVQKEFIEEKHAEFSAVIQEMEAGFEGNPLLEGDSLQAGYMNKLYSSMLEDARFFGELENANYSKAMNAANKEEIEQAFIEEVAIELVFQDALMLNAYPADAGYWQYFDEGKEEEIGAAQEVFPFIFASGFLDSGVSAEMLAEFGLNKGNIEEKAEAVMEEYIALRKEKFTEALAKDELSAFVEANKINGLYELSVGSE